MSGEQWRLGDNGDGRQWWTIVTEHGEIVAQAIRREDAERIVTEHNQAALLERYRAALEWYADPANYQKGIVGEHYNLVLWRHDEGQRARAALHGKQADGEVKGE